MGINKLELEALLDQIEKNHHATINYSEFMVASLNRRKMLTDTRIEACFKLFDKVAILIPSITFLG